MIITEKTMFKCFYLISLTISQYWSTLSVLEQILAYALHNRTAVDVLVAVVQNKKKQFTKKLWQNVKHYFVLDIPSALTDKLQKCANLAVT